MTKEQRAEKRKQLKAIRNRESAELVSELLFDRVKQRRLALLKEGIWLTAKQEEVKIVEMTDNHLACTIRLYDRRWPPFGTEEAEDMITPLLVEAEKRTLEE